MGGRRFVGGTAVSKAYATAGTHANTPGVGLHARDRAREPHQARALPRTNLADGAAGVRHAGVHASRARVSRRVAPRRSPSPKMKRDPPGPPSLDGPAEPIAAAAGARAFWWSCVVAAPPVAFAVAASGYPMAVRDPLPELALIVVWSVAEEIVFRGALQPALARFFERRFGSAAARAWLTPANLATSALFAALHLWRHPFVAALGVFPVSLVYGRARELGGHWWPAAALHLFFNLLLYAASWWLARGG